MSGADDRRHREIDEEIQAHLAARIEHLLAQGLTPEAARAEAMRRFGDVEAGRARLHAQAIDDRRRRRLVDHVEAIGTDVRYVCRSLWRQPSFTFGVVATLTIGLGVNAAVFRVADRVLFRPPDAVVDAGGIRRVEATVTGPAAEAVNTSQFSYPDADAMAGSTAFASASINTLPRIVADRDGRNVALCYADASYFRVLGLVPAAGRFFDETEGTPGSGVPVAVVSDRFWRRQLGAAPIAPDLAVALPSGTFRVVGVAPPGFTGIDLDPADLWLPFGVAELGQGMVNGVVIPWYRSDMLRGVRVIGRPPRGGTDAVVAGTLTAAMAARVSAQPDDRRRMSLASIVPAGGAVGSDVSRVLLARLSGVAGIVLLIAAANAMHLLLARGARRHREIATRMALGASRARVWRLLMVESVILALAGGVAASLVGGWTATALRRLVFPDGHWTVAPVDARTLLFTGALALVAGVVAGWGPARQATSPDLVSAIKTGRAGATRTRRRTRSAILIAQTALSIVLLVGSGLLVLSLTRLSRFNLGFEPDGLVTAAFSATSLSSRPDAAAIAALARRVRDTEPDAGVALASVAPFGAVKVTDVIVPGSAYTPPSNRDLPRVMDVSADYFAVMRARVTWGRAFDAADAAGEPVAVVNASMARNYWGATLPPGACVLPVGSPCARVVGIIEDMNDSPGGAPAPMRFYLVLSEEHGQVSTIVMRTTAQAAPDVAARLRSSVPTGYRATIEVTADRIDRALRPWRTATTLFVMLGLVAIALACVGAYSIMSYAASERAHEMGVRVALGASAGDVRRLVIGGGLRLAVAGGLIGLVFAAAVGRLLSALLFDVSPFEPGIYSAAFGVMTLAALASMMPAAQRASRVDATVALRTE